MGDGLLFFGSNFKFFASFGCRNGFFTKMKNPVSLLYLQVPFKFFASFSFSGIPLKAGVKIANFARE